MQRKEFVMTPVSSGTPSTDQFGYGALQILEKADRVKALQRELCTQAIAGANVEIIDRAALLGLMQIVGELEYGLREVIGEVFPDTPRPNTVVGRRR
ncbi:hypothetical protein SEA_GEAZY_47 [Gordonia phage GEazy]|nr:hypothetical protein SEA_GEAZY_47 [Gordonia phage GEazy]